MIYILLCVGNYIYSIMCEYLQSQYFCEVHSLFVFDILVDGFLCPLSQVWGIAGESISVEVYSVWWTGSDASDLQCGSPLWCFCIIF